MFFLGIKHLTSIVRPFFSFLLLFNIFHAKTYRNHIRTSPWKAQNPNTGQTMQHLIFFIFSFLAEIPTLNESFYFSSWQSNRNTGANLSLPSWSKLPLTTQPKYLQLRVRPFKYLPAIRFRERFSTNLDSRKLRKFLKSMILKPENRFSREIILRFMSLTFEIRLKLRSCTHETLKYTFK